MAYSATQWRKGSIPPGDAAPEPFGDEVAGEHSWSSGAKLGDWAGQAVRLELDLKDADLYSQQV